MGENSFFRTVLFGFAALLAGCGGAFVHADVAPPSGASITASVFDMLGSAPNSPDSPTPAPSPVLPPTPAPSSQDASSDGAPSTPAAITASVFGNSGGGGGSAAFFGATSTTSASSTPALWLPFVGTTSTTTSQIGDPIARSVKCGLLQQIGPPIPAFESECASVVATTTPTSTPSQGGEGGGGGGGGTSGGGGGGGGTSGGGVSSTGGGAGGGSSGGGSGGSAGGGSVLGASASAPEAASGALPGVPNTGAGGERPQTLFVLIIAALAVIAGFFYIGHLLREAEPLSRTTPSQPRLPRIAGAICHKLIRSAKFVADTI